MGCVGEEEYKKRIKTDKFQLASDNILFRFPRIKFVASNVF